MDASGVVSLRSARGGFWLLFCGVFLLGGALRVVAEEQPGNVEPLAPAEGDGTRSGLYDYGQSLSVGESPTSVSAELEGIYRPSRGVLDLPLADQPFEFVLRNTQELEAATGLRLGMAYTVLFQQASGGPGDRSAGSGDLDLMGQWTLINRGTANAGRLVFSGEYRHDIGSQPASALRGEIGTLQGTTNGFNDRGWVVRDLHFIQHVLDGKLRLGFGRADPSDFVGGHRMQNLNASFFNRAFSSNSVIPFPGHGITAGLSVRPNDSFYATVGATNAYGQTTVNDMSDLDELDFFSFGEFGFTPVIEGLGPGRYRLLLWHMDARELDNLPSDRGFSVILEQDLGQVVQVFGRYGYSDESLTNIESSTEVGVGLRGLLGSEDNLTGLAFGYSVPRRGVGRDEKIVELFHRFQLTNFTQLSFGATAIIDPSNAPDSDVIGVFSTRFRIAF